MPAPLSFLIVSIVTLAVMLAALHLMRRRFPAEVLKENHDVAAVIFDAFGLLYAVIVAFVVFVTWTGYDEARKNLELEASEAIDIFRNAEAFPPPLNDQVRAALSGYVHFVIDNELDRLATENITLAGRRSERSSHCSMAWTRSGAITIGYTFLFGTRNAAAHHAMTAGLTLTVTLILFLLLILDHPFTGANRITALPLREAISLMERDTSQTPQ